MRYFKVYVRLSADGLEPMIDHHWLMVPKDSNANMDDALLLGRYRNMTGDMTIEPFRTIEYTRDEYEMRTGVQPQLIES